MKKLLILLAILLGNTLFAQKNIDLQKVDSIIGIRIKPIQSQIDKFNRNVDTLKIQKTFFSDLLSAQNNIYSINTTWFSASLMILFGLIAFIAYWQITSKINSEVQNMNKKRKEMDNKYEKIEEDQTKIKKDLYEEKGNLYFTYMLHLKNDDIERLKYCVLTIKNFILANKYEIAYQKLQYFETEIWGKLTKVRYSEEAEYKETLMLILEMLQINSIQKDNLSKPVINKTFTEVISTFNKLKP